MPDIPWWFLGWLPQYRAEGPPRFAHVTDADWGHLALTAWSANLIDRDGTSVVLDWSFTTLNSAIGEDVANLIIDSCTNGLMDAALLPEIAGSVTSGYLSGLRDGGWAGSALLITDNRDEIWP